LVTSPKVQEGCFGCTVSEMMSIFWHENVGWEMHRYPSGNTLNHKISQRIQFVRICWHRKMGMVRGNAKTARRTPQQSRLLRRAALKREYLLDNEGKMRLLL
jgi:hypothetical protein